MFLVFYISVCVAGCVANECVNIANMQPRKASRWLNQACHNFDRARLVEQCRRLFKEHRYINFKEKERIAINALQEANAQGVHFHNIRVS